MAEKVEWVVRRKKGRRGVREIHLGGSMGVTGSTGEQVVSGRKNVTWEEK